VLSCKSLRPAGNIDAIVGTAARFAVVESTLVPAEVRGAAVGDAWVESTAGAGAGVGAPC
jgi:hypothetical protein